MVSRGKGKGEKEDGETARRFDGRSHQGPIKYGTRWRKNLGSSPGQKGKRMTDGIVVEVPDLGN